MPRRFVSRHSFRTMAPFYLAMLLLVLSLVITLAGGWAFYSLLRETRESDLDQRLIAFAQAAEPALSDRADFALLGLLDQDIPAEDDATWKREFSSLLAVYPDRYQVLRQLLQDLAETPYAGLSSLVLISPQGRVIASADKEISPGEEAPFADVDKLAFESALKGNPGSVPVYEYEGKPYKRVYAPIHIRAFAEEKTEPQVGAVLQMEAGFDALKTVTNLRTQGLILAAIVAAMLSGVAFLFFRLVRLVVVMSERAAHRDRLEAMGTLAAGIAHEIRNPLGIIRVLTESLRSDLEEQPEEKEMLDDIMGEVERLNELVNQYLAFARPEQGASETGVDPARVIAPLATLLEKSSPGKVDLEIEVPEDIPKVRMNETAFRQVMLNLLLNAREASAENQPVRVRAATIKGGTQVEISVRDEGAGIPERDLRRIFDPFYTTKTKGSGLGLAISYHLVTECEGTIEISSRPGEGTVARVVLPAVRE